MQQKQAAIIIIGNEILSGRTQDLNLNFIATELSKLGINLSEGSVIPDDVELIAAKVSEFSQRYDYVFTSGGIGPTHDDVTSEAIAKACETPLVVNQVAKEVLEDYYQDLGGMNKARLKMATIPEGADIIPNKVSSAPGYKINNIFALAGIPKIMHGMFEALKTHLDSGPLTTNAAVNIQVSESKIADKLDQLQHDYSNVSIGSYPFTNIDGPATSIVIRGLEEAQVEQVTQELYAFCNESNLAIINDR